MLTPPFARSAVTDKRRSVMIFKGKRAPGTGGATAALTRLTGRDRQGTSRAKSGARSRSCVHPRPAHARKNTRGFSRSLRQPRTDAASCAYVRLHLPAALLCLLSGARLRIKTQSRQSFVSFSPDRAPSGLDTFQATPFPFLSTRTKDIYLSTD